MGDTLPNRATYKTSRIAKKFNNSKSQYAMSMMPIPKKDGSWRMCMDYHPINAIIIRYRQPIPSLDNFLDELHGACIFSKIAFKTKFGVYEWLVMPFGLMNTPSMFMRLMNHVLRSLIAYYVIVYFDDILVYSTRDIKKVKAIQSWSIPTCVKLPWVASFCRCFVGKFNTIAAPLNEAIKKDVGFRCKGLQEQAFQTLKETLSNAFVLERHPIAFFIEKLKGAQLNYPTYDKVLFSCSGLASVVALPTIQ
ncbi:Retrovirus-related Pol polyprotein from transposon 17.6, partial [Mucuna pruriens]